MRPRTVRELAAVALVGDIRIGTWDRHPDDLIRAFIALYDGWDQPERVEEYRRPSRRAGIGEAQAAQ